jgi:hypothetical protein
MTMLIQKKIQMSAQIEKICDAIKASCKGFNDNTTLINTVGLIVPSMVPDVQKTFQKKYNIDIIDFLDKEVSGDYGRLMKAIMVVEAGEYAAKEIHSILNSMMKDYTALAEILIGRTNEEQKAINSTYYKLYSHYLVDDINKKLSGNIRKLLEAQVNCKRDEGDLTKPSVSEDVQALNKAGKGLFTDDGPFVTIFSTRSFQHLRKVMVEYAQYHHKSFIDAIISQFTGNTETFFVNYARCIENPSLHYATMLEDSMKGIGTNESSLCRLLVRLRSNGMMKETRENYMKKYNKSLDDRIVGETSGNYRDLLLKVIHVGCLCSSNSPSIPNTSNVSSNNPGTSNNYQAKPTNNIPTQSNTPKQSSFVQPISNTQAMSPVGFIPPPQGYTQAPAANYGQPAAHVHPYVPQILNSSPQGYSPQGYPPQGYPAQGFAPQGYPPQGVAPQSYPSQGFAPQGYPPQGFTPQGYPPQGFTPQGYPPQGFATQGYPPQGFAPQGYSPQGFASQGYPPQGFVQQGTGYPGSPR